MDYDPFDGRDYNFGNFKYYPSSAAAKLVSALALSSLFSAMGAYAFHPYNFWRSAGTRGPKPARARRPVPLRVLGYAKAPQSGAVK